MEGGRLRLVPSYEVFLGKREGNVKLHIKITIKTILKTLSKINTNTVIKIHKTNS
jgi:hypothetical protein